MPPSTLLRDEADETRDDRGRARRDVHDEQADADDRNHVECTGDSQRTSGGAAVVLAGDAPRVEGVRESPTAIASAPRIELTAVLSGIPERAVMCLAPASTTTTVGIVSS